MATLKRGNPEEEFDCDSALALAGIIEDSVHFILPENGLILDDGLRGLEGVELNLPFPSITIEFRWAEDWKVVCSASDHEDHIIVMAAINMPSRDGDVWYPEYLMMDVPKDINIGGKRLSEKQKSKILAPSAYKAAQAQGLTSSQASELIGSHEYSIEELIEALSCANVTHEVIEKVNPAMNARRIRDGKLPIYETRRLVINAGKSVASKSDIAGTHASPRQHLRRGHIRRLEDKNIWVNSCVVAANNPAKIVKTYAVRDCAA